MATSSTNLRVRISADLADIKQGLGLLRGELAKVKGQADKSLGNNTNLMNGLRGMRSAVLGLAGALGAGLSAAGLIRISDEAKEVNARLKLATRSTNEFSVAQEGLFDISQRTRTALSASIDLYYRLERSTRQLNLSQATLLQLTETINKAGQIGGGGPAFEASLVQFGQALQSGDLSAVAQEMNSIQEQAPRLAEAIVTGLKQLGFEGSNSLKKLISEGGVQVQDLLRAILTQVDAVDAEFAELPETIHGGFTRIRNAFVQYISTSDQADKTSAAVANALRAIAENLPTIINAFVRLGSVVTAYLVTFKLIPGVYRTVIGLTTALTGANAGLAASFQAAGTAGAKGLLALRLAGTTLLAFFAGWQIGSLLREKFVSVRVAGIYLAQSLHKVAVSIAHYFTSAGPRIKLAMLDAFNFLLDVAGKMNAAIIGVLEKIPGPIGRAYAAMRDKSKSFLQGLRADTSEVAEEVAKLDAELAAKLADINDAYGAQVNDAYAEAAGRGRATLDTGTGEVGLGGGVGSGILGTTDQAALAIDLIKRKLEELDRQYEESKRKAAEAFRQTGKLQPIDIAGYYRERAKLQLQAIDLEIAQARAEAATAKTTEQQSAALTRIVKLQRDRAEIGPQAVRDQLAAEKELHTERLRQLEEQSQAVQTRLQNTETSIGAQVGAGLMGGLEGERRIREAREAALTQLRALRESALAYLATLNPASPEAQAVLDYLQQLNGGLADIQAAQRKLVQDMKGEAVSAFRGMFAALRGDIDSAKDAVKGFFDSIIDGIARVLEQKASEQLVNWIFSLFTPGNAAAGGGGSVRSTGPVMHGGGIVGSTGSWTRSLNPLLFGTAPRFHAGGFPGLAPDEVAAVLQRGEEVITENDRRHTRNGGRRGASGSGVDRVVINNYTDATPQIREQPNASGGRDTIVTLKRLARESVAEDIVRGDGPVSKALTGTTNVRRTGRR